MMTTIDLGTPTVGDAVTYTEDGITYQAVVAGTPTTGRLQIVIPGLGVTIFVDPDEVSW
jgi:hypothetical protein